MSDYYRPQRSKNLFDPASKEPFKLSRSRLELFTNCPRCFYIDRRLGVDRPPGYPFSLNSAVDKLLKKEFDSHRINGTAHPLMETYKIDAIPFNSEKLDEWRDPFKGIQYVHEDSNFLVTGGVDDVWVTPKGELMIVDYKATSKEEEVTLDAAWQDGYKRQVEIYQWLFYKNGFRVYSTAYFVYANGDADKEAFDSKLEFHVKVIPYEADFSWVEKSLIDAANCLRASAIPEANPNCDYCSYREAAKKVENP